MAAGDASVEPHAPIHVLVANIAGTLPEHVVQLIAQQPDMRLVGQAESQIELLLAAANAIDVLVLIEEQATPLPGICSHLLAEFPDLRILVVSSSDEAATLYWLGLRRQHLRRVRPAALVEGIRHVFHVNPTV
jgi:DNA-binding NarL/FixJ family response regulator